MRAVVRSVAAALLVALAVPAWSAERAVTYGVVTTTNVAISMDDGVVLKANVSRPANGDGTAARGRFPVLLAQTPYGKDGPITSVNSYLVSRGYIEVVVDIRGRGASQGTWDSFSPREAKDGAALVRWASRLPGSTGVVGLLGDSYLGINQLFTAAAVGPGSPLKAIFPAVAANDLYRDVVMPGGMPNQGFPPLDVGLNTTTGVLDPTTEDRSAAGETPGRVVNALVPVASIQSEFQTGGRTAFDRAYWRTRSPSSTLAAIVRNGVPAYLVGGWYDLFQRGPLLNYAGLQNAWAGRPVGAPMAPGQRVTSRYQVLMGPWYHTTFGAGVDLNRLQLQWFDRWLKGVRNGIDATSTPAHLAALGTTRWYDGATVPFDGTTVRSLLLSSRGSASGARSYNDGSLSTEKRADAAEALPWVPVSSPCNRQALETQVAGLPAMVVPPPRPDERCTEDDRTTGATGLTYTTEPFPRPTTLGGPLAASLWVSSTTTDIALAATVEDVTPDGTARPLTYGNLLGSFRALDRGRTWTVQGKVLMPYHPFDVARLVPTSTPVRLDVELMPVLAELGAGHRLRLTLTTGDTGHATPAAYQLPGLVGGVYAVHVGGTTQSSLTLPVIRPGALRPWAPPG